jgi:hypothetical protein
MANAEIKMLVDNIIDGNDNIIINYAQTNNLPQICLYYAFGMNNLNLCQFCIDNGCVLDDYTLRMAFILHEPGLLALFIRNKYPINNNYVEYFLRYDTIYLCDGVTKYTSCHSIGSFTDNSMYNIATFDTKYSYDINDADNKILHNALLTFLEKKREIQDFPGRTFNKFLKFEWYCNKYNLRSFIMNKYTKYKFHKEIQNINEMLDLLKNHNNYILDDDMKKRFIINQILKHEYIDELNRYGISFTLNTLMTEIKKAPKISKKHQNLLKKIIKKANIKIF